MGFPYRAALHLLDPHATWRTIQRSPKWCNMVKCSALAGTGSDQNQYPVKIIPKKKMTQASKAKRHFNGAVRNSMKCRNTSRTLKAEKTKAAVAVMCMSIR